MNPSEIAAADQYAARERDFDRRAQQCAIIVAVCGVLLGVYSALILTGVVPPAPLPWTPAGVR